MTKRKRRTHFLNLLHEASQNPERRFFPPPTIGYYRRKFHFFLVPGCGVLLKCTFPICIDFNQFHRQAGLSQCNVCLYVCQFQKDDLDSDNDRQTGRQVLISSNFGVFFWKKWRQRVDAEQHALKRIENPFTKRVQETKRPFNFFKFFPVLC